MEGSIRPVSVSLFVCLYVRLHACLSVSLPWPIQSTPSTTVDISIFKLESLLPLFSSRRAPFTILELYRQSVAQRSWTTKKSSINWFLGSKIVKGPIGLLGILRNNTYVCSNKPAYSKKVGPTRSFPEAPTYFPPFYGPIQYHQKVFFSNIILAIYLPWQHNSYFSSPCVLFGFCTFFDCYRCRRSF